MATNSVHMRILLQKLAEAAQQAPYGSTPVDIQNQNKRRRLISDDEEIGHEGYAFVEKENYNNRFDDDDDDASSSSGYGKWLWPTLGIAALGGAGYLLLSDKGKENIASVVGSITSTGDSNGTSKQKGGIITSPPLAASTAGAATVAAAAASVIGAPPPAGHGFGLGDSRSRVASGISNLMAPNNINDFITKLDVGVQRLEVLANKPTQPGALAAIVGRPTIPANNIASLRAEAVSITENVEQAASRVKFTTSVASDPLRGTTNVLRAVQSYIREGRLPAIDRSVFALLASNLSVTYTDVSGGTPVQKTISDVRREPQALSELVDAVRTKKAQIDSIKLVPPAELSQSVQSQLTFTIYDRSTASPRGGTKLASPGDIANHLAIISNYLFTVQDPRARASIAFRVMNIGNDPASEVSQPATLLDSTVRTTKNPKGGTVYHYSDENILRNILNYATHGSINWKLYALGMVPDVPQLSVQDWSKIVDLVNQSGASFVDTVNVAFYNKLPKHISNTYMAIPAVRRVGATRTVAAAGSGAAVGAASYGLIHLINFLYNLK